MFVLLVCGQHVGRRSVVQGSREIDQKMSTNVPNIAIRGATPGKQTVEG
jgi:hypothetical protein